MQHHMNHYRAKVITESRNQKQKKKQTISSDHKILDTYCIYICTHISKKGKQKQNSFYIQK